MPLPLRLLRGAIGGSAPAPTMLFVFIGESNSGGQALNTGLTVAEAQTRSSVQILNNNTLAWQSLLIGTNNNLGHTGITNGTQHGLENQLANIIDDGRIPGVTQCYLVKAGQGGSYIAQWTTGNGTGYWTTFLNRINAAKALLAGQTLTPVVFYSLGINDALLATNVTTWKTAVIDHLARIRTELGATTPIIMTKFEGPNMTARATYNTAMDEIAAGDSYTKTISTAGLTVEDTNHWNAAGFREIGEKFFNAYYSAAVVMSDPAASPAATAYASAQSVTLSSSAGATIRYTTDGTPATPLSPVYSSAISAPSSTEIRARAYKPASQSSSEVSLPFFIGSSPWVTWSSMQNASQSGENIVSNGSSPGGGLYATPINGTGPVSIVSYHESSAKVSGVVTLLDDDNTAAYSWGSQVFRIGFYALGGTLYWVTNAGAGSGTLTSTSYPCHIRMSKSGNDAVFERSTNGVSGWTTIGTVTGVFAGAANLYLKTVFAVPNAANAVKTRLA